MDIFEAIKQLKKIQPDESSQRESKYAILSEIPLEYVNVKKIFSPRAFAFRIVEASIGVVAVGFFIVIISGGFINNSVSPIKFSAIDPVALHAEAQVVETQIQLANLNYSEPLQIVQSTQKLAAIIKNRINNSSTTVSAVVSSSTIDSTSTPTMSIDEALKALE